MYVGGCRGDLNALDKCGKCETDQSRAMRDGYASLVVARVLKVEKGHLVSWDSGREGMAGVVKSMYGWRIEGLKD